MRNPPPGVLLAALVVVGLHAGQATPIRADQAKASVGQLVTIEDAVAQISREPQSGFTYLNFGAAYPNQIFRVVIPQAVERLMEASIFRTERMRVRGIPQLGLSGIPEIVCSEPSQLVAAASAMIAPTPGMTPSAATPANVIAPPVAPAAPTRSCTRVCRTGKACGNTCIARTATCRQPPGTACDG